MFHFDQASKWFVESVIGKWKTGRPNAELYEDSQHPKRKEWEPCRIMPSWGQCSPNWEMSLLYKWISRGQSIIQGYSHLLCNILLLLSETQGHLWRRKDHWNTSLFTNKRDWNTWVSIPWNLSIHGGLYGPRRLEKIDTAAVFLLVLNIRKGWCGFTWREPGHEEVWEVFLTVCFMQEIHSHTFTGQTASL